MRELSAQRLSSLHDGIPNEVCRLQHISTRRLNHAHNLASVHNAIQTLSINEPVATPTCEQFVPPTEEEVAGNELEPWREGVGFSDIKL